MRVSVLMGVLTGFVLASSVEALLIDDFSDGNDDGWNRGGNLEPLSQPMFDASSGRYQMGSSGDVDWLLETPTSQVFPGLGAGYISSSGNSQYGNGVFTVNVILDNSSSSAFLSLRGAPQSPPGRLWASAYHFSVNNAGDALYIARQGGDSACAAQVAAECYLGSLGLSPGSVSAGIEYFLQASAIGDTLGLKFWAATDPEPSAPQLTALTTQHLVTLSGTGIGVGLYASEVISVPTEFPGIVTSPPISGSFDNVSFSPIPEPTTASLLALGLLGLAMRRREGLRLHTLIG